MGVSQIQLPLPGELVVDNFAGGGGASAGIEQGIGRPVDIAVNHDGQALAMHLANHPETAHYCENVFDIDPNKVTGGQPVGLAWFSPDCTFHSKARGGKPFRDKRRANRRRGLANIVIKWARLVKPRVIMLENVEEFQKWGPLLDNGKPCPERKGLSFRRWKRSLENLGYKVDYKELRACDYGAPTIRKRLFLIARCDGLPIVWPKPTHGEGLIPYKTAAECIDWSIPCPSIFERKRPLAEKTMKRIATGIDRYVLNAKEPFIVTCNHSDDCFRGQGVYEPMKTITSARDAHGVVVPHLSRYFGTGVGHPVTEPTRTVTCDGQGKSALVSAFLTEHANGSHQRNFGADQPLRTQCAQTKGGHFALIAPFLATHNGGSIGAQVDRPAVTVTSKNNHALVKAFLINYYSNGSGKTGASVNKPAPTIPTKDRIGLVTIHGIDYQIIDIGMRMLTPRELFRAQGFEDSYIIDPTYNGKPLTKTSQVRMCGNSVCPPVVKALIEANFEHEMEFKEHVA